VSVLSTIAGLDLIVECGAGCTGFPVGGSTGTLDEVGTVRGVSVDPVRFALAELVDVPTGPGSGGLRRLSVLGSVSVGRLGPGSVRVRRLSVCRTVSGHLAVQRAGVVFGPVAEA